MPISRRTSGSWRWYHALAFYAGVQAVTFGLENLTKRAQGHPASDDKRFYGQLKEPVFAPPSWAFAPAWTFNSLSLLWGLLRALNLPRRTPGRRAFIGLQGAFWLSYMSFSTAFFGLRSPILGAVVTNLCLGVTAASEYVAVTRIKDGKVSASQISTLLWLVIASATANMTALWNRDQLLNTPAPQTPPPKLLKQPSSQRMGKEVVNR